MRTRHLAVVAVALTLAVVGAACTEGDTVVNTPGTTAGISVTGSGQAFGTPDIALVTLGVQARASTVAEARDSAASTGQAVVDSLKKNGVADKDIQTVQFDIQPQYDFRPDGTQTIRGYQVTNVLSVKVRKIETTSKVLDDATAAGGNNAIVRGLSFTIDDPSKLRASARSDALKQAREKAEQLANDAGVKLGKPISISESGGPVPLPANALVAPRTGPGDVSTPIQTGEMQVNITVTVLYAID